MTAGGEGEVPGGGWDVQDAVRDLAECYRLSCADPDGDEDWRLATAAVPEVRRLRKDYDEACDENVTLAREARELRAALSKLSAMVRRHLDGGCGVLGVSVGRANELVATAERLTRPATTTEEVANP